MFLYHNKEPVEETILSDALYPLSKKKKAPDNGAFSFPYMKQ